MKGFLPAYDAAVDVDELYERTFGAPVLREDESPSPASCASQQVRFLLFSTSRSTTDAFLNRTEHIKKRGLALRGQSLLRSIPVKTGESPTNRRPQQPVITLRSSWAKPQMYVHRFILSVSASYLIS